MPHLLHIDSSIQGEASVSRTLTARAAQAWKAANPDGTVTYRDLAADPLPLLTGEQNYARFLPVEQYTPAQVEARALTQQLADEILAADTVILGLPLYNYNAPATVKTWVDHLVFPGVTTDPATSEGLLGGRKFQVIATRGGGYGEGTPRHGWDHASPWLVQVLSTLGIEADVIAVELTLAGIVPAMEPLKPLAAESLAAGHRDIDAVFGEPVAASA
ncbi:MAG: NAD(P)H-dependent oxidoreductase [Solirubrobacteraceae bacterium]|nr:NAD(P)H-dependent oxidoreductase [Solirubrobacteraceae bacterium]